MRSLRTRLTFAYTVFLGLLLATVAVVTSQLALSYLSRPVMKAFFESQASARAIIAAQPTATFATLERAIVQTSSRPGVSIIAVQNGRLHNAGPPRDVFQHFPDARLLVRLGLEPIFLPVRNGTIVITPDYRRLSRALRGYITFNISATLAGFVVAWLIARWLTSQAIGPLVLVTSELERFGRGDFSPRPVTAGGLSELGRLTTAYNAAVSQVSSAFEERERVATELRALLGDAGHTLRTPLTVVSGFLEVLDGAPLEDRSIRERAVRSMRVETRRMRLLVEGLMSLARMEQAETRSLLRIDVGAAAYGAIERVRVVRGGDITLRLSGAPTVLADPAEVNEAVANLVENAVKYGASTAVTVDVVEERSSVLVRVRDRGPGIPPNERSRIFERFFRSEEGPAVDGSGLGLAIVKRAMDRCGGTVELERADGGDTSFILRFQAAGKPA